MYIVQPYYRPVYSIYSRFQYGPFFLTFKQYFGLLLYGYEDTEYSLTYWLAY